MQISDPKSIKNNPKMCRFFVEWRNLRIFANDLRDTLYLL